jgi:subtilase family serine protease
MRHLKVLLMLIYGVFLKVDIYATVSKYTISMNSHRQEHLILKNHASHDLLHEIVFAVRQRNLDKLESELLERSTPGNPKFQQWLTFQEVGDFTSNPSGAAKLKDWLFINNATVIWESLHSDYIRAVATVSVWNYLFDTVFHSWENKRQFNDFSHKPLHQYKAKLRDKPGSKSPFLILAKDYTIPVAIRRHISTAFNTVQPPPLLSPRYHTRIKGSPIRTDMQAEDVS